MIGPALRAAREARGLSIEDIKVTTLMMVKQIEDLENDKFEDFSAPVYTRGFIKLYARAVGLDPDPLVAEYMATYGAGNSDNRQPVVPLEMATEAGAPLEVVTPVVPESERDHVAIPDSTAVHNRAPEPQPMPKPAAPAPAEAPAAAAPEKPAEKTPEPDLLQLMEATPAPEPAAPAALQRVLYLRVLRAHPIIPHVPQRTHLLGEHIQRHVMLLHVPRQPETIQICVARPHVQRVVMVTCPPYANRHPPYTQLRKRRFHLHAVWRIMLIV